MTRAPEHRFGPIAKRSYKCGDTTRTRNRSSIIHFAKGRRSSCWKVWTKKTGSLSKMFPRASIPYGEHISELFLLARHLEDHMKSDGWNRMTASQVGIFAKLP